MEELTPFKAVEVDRVYPEGSLRELHNFRELMLNAFIVPEELLKDNRQRSTKDVLNRGIV